MFNWFKKPEPKVIIHEITPMDNMDDDELYERCRGLFGTLEWEYFIEKVRRERNKSMSDLAYSETTDQIGRIQGRIKAYDWILMISNIHANELTQ